jgi:sorting nexin-1/2
LIELWETILMQLDAEENEEVYYKPHVETAAKAAAERPAEQSQAAAVITAEDDDD